jgi:hypothetical protein
MKVDKFMTLSARQQHAMVLAMAVRNALEDFHVANLSQAQMKELNQLIRFSLYDTVSLIETMAGDREKRAFYG